MPSLPFDGDDDELVDAFADEQALEDFFGVEEGEAGFSWKSVISGEVFEEQPFYFKRGGWTWKDYYKTVRDWVRQVLGAVSPEMTSIHSAPPK